MNEIKSERGNEQLESAQCEHCGAKLSGSQLITTQIPLIPGTVTTEISFRLCGKCQGLLIRALFNSLFGGDGVVIFHPSSIAKARV